MPRMTWTGDTVPPAAPFNLTRLDNFIMWDDSSHTDVSYNLYGSNSYPVDTERAENLLKTGLREKQLFIKARTPLPRYIAICAMDRMGNESAALQEKLKQSRPDSRKAWNPLSRLGESGKRVDDRRSWHKSSKWKALKSVSDKKAKKRKSGR